MNERFEERRASLPLELLPHILDQVHATNRVADLAAASRVSKAWCYFARPRLWRRLWFRDLNRVRPVFRALARYPHLCELVKVLELRVYPFGLAAADLESLEADVCTALSAMIQLEELYWTRTGSLNDRMLPYLVQGKTKLRHLELLGNTRQWGTSLPMLWTRSGHYATMEADPFPALQSLSFILPDTGAMQAVLEIARRRPLRSLNLLCQYSSVFLPVHADLLSASGSGDDTASKEPHGGLHQLERLVLVGCKRVEGDSVKKLVAASKGGVRVLGLEGCGVHPSALPGLIPSLRSSLTTLTLTLPRTALCPHKDFYAHLSTFVSGLPHLAEFTLYAPAGVRSDDTLEFHETQEEAGDDGDGHEDEDGEQGDPRLETTTRNDSTAPAHLPHLPVSFLEALLLDRLTALPHRRLKLLRIYGIVCSLDGLHRIGTDGGPGHEEMNGQETSCTSNEGKSQGKGKGIRDLVVQLEHGNARSITELLRPLYPQLEKLHLLARSGASLTLTEEGVSEIASKHILSSQLALNSGQRRPTRQRSNLSQIGFRNRVWEVHRELLPKKKAKSLRNEQDGPQDGADHKQNGAGHGHDESLQVDAQEEVSVNLRRWDASEGRWPEALLVVKA